MMELESETFYIHSQHTNSVHYAWIIDYFRIVTSKGCSKGCPGRKGFGRVATGTEVVTVGVPIGAADCEGEERGLVACSRIVSRADTGLSGRGIRRKTTGLYRRLITGAIRRLIRRHTARVKG
jgi:hypothetical protein